MARRPTQIGHAGAPLRLVPMDPDPAPTVVGAAPDPDGDDERTTVEQPPEPAAAPPARAARVTRTGETSGPAAGHPPLDEQWDDGTTMDEATMAGSPPAEGQSDGFPGDEMTVDEPPRHTQAQVAKLVVVAGNDTGREFALAPGKPLTVGRAIDNDIVLTDIAVSRKHLDLMFDGSYWVLRDRGSGNGTLLNERIEDGSCRLQHNDRIEIGHTVFRFDHAASAGAPSVGWGEQNDEEASTVAGRAPSRPGTASPAPAAAAPVSPRRRPGTASAPPPVPSPAGDRPRATLPPPRAHPPSQPPPDAGAVSSRLALPPVAAPPDEPVRAAEPSFLGGAAQAPPLHIDARRDLRHEMRTMTSTAHVEPLAYSSGSIAPIRAYAPRRAAEARRKQVAVIGLATAGVVLIGVIAMLTSDPGSAPHAAAADAGAATSALPREPDPWATAGEPAATSPDGDGGDGDGDGDPTTPTPTVAVEPDPPPVEDSPEKRPSVADQDPPPPPKVTRQDPVPAVVKQDPAPEKKPAPPPRKDPPPRVSKVVKKPPPPPEKKPARAASADAAKRKAAALYESKEFKEAAAVVREAASSASTEDAATLRALAKNYDTLSSSWAAGNAAAAGKPTDALAAYKRALAADKKLGGSHAAMIRDKLAQVAPRAAAGFMAKGNYEAAKQAADTAVNFGAGTNATVTQVRQSLERKAGEFYASGQKLLSSKPDEAKALLRRILKIVPPDSPWYTKAYKALNARAQVRDDDE